MKVTVILMTCMLLIPFTVHAQEEAWYAYLAMGKGFSKYPSQVEENFKAVDNNHTHYTIDAGLYWPFGSGYLLGANLTDTFDTVEGNRNNKKLMYEVEQGIYSISGIKYFGSEIGRGIFIRGDLGAVSVITRNVNFETDEPWEKAGYGIKLVAGYSIPIVEGTSLVFSLMADFNQVSDGRYNSAMATVGVLW